MNDTLRFSSCDQLIIRLHSSYFHFLFDKIKAKTLKLMLTDMSKNEIDPFLDQLFNIAANLSNKIWKINLFDLKLRTRSFVGQLKFFVALFGSMPLIEKLLLTYTSSKENRFQKYSIELSFRLSNVVHYLNAQVEGDNAEGH